jgi:hypothetical protein
LFGLPVMTGSSRAGSLAHGANRQRATLEGFDLLALVKQKPPLGANEARQQGKE